MILYLVVIAVLNTAVGFLLAVYIVPPTAFAGLGTRLSMARAIRLRRAIAPTSAAEPASRASESIAEQKDPAAPTDASAESPPPDNLDAPQNAPMSPSDIGGDTTTDQIPTEWLDTLEEYGIQAAHLVEASAQVLRLEVGHYRDRLVRIDGRARKTIDAVDVGTLRMNIDELREINEDWLSKQADSVEHLSSRSGSLGDQGVVARRLLDILENQQSQIETTFSNFNELDIEGDPLGSGKRILVELRKMLDMAHTLRDRMFELLVEIRRIDGRFGDIDQSMMFDGLTKLHNRAGLEKVLDEQFISDRTRSRQLSCALIDVDRFSRHMDEFGPVVCDRLLIGLGEVLDSLLRKDRGFDMTARFEGQRFFLLLADTGPRSAMSAVERIRQTIEQTTFQYENHVIETTIRSGVVELGHGESADALFGRLEAAVDQAKNFGRNCTALDEGEGPTRITAPEFEVTGRIVKLT